MGDFANPQPETEAVGDDSASKPPKASSTVVPAHTTSGCFLRGSDGRERQPSKFPFVGLSLPTLRREAPMADEIKEPILNYWYRALHSPHGIELICSDPEAIRARLYAARKEVRDLDLEQISTVLSPFDPMKLWLIRKDRKGPVDAQT